MPGLGSLLGVSHGQSGHQQAALSAGPGQNPQQRLAPALGRIPVLALAGLTSPSFVALSWASAIEAAAFLATVPFIPNQQHMSSPAAAPNLSD